jgi:hypothetical protein
VQQQAALFKLFHRTPTHTEATTNEFASYSHCAFDAHVCTNRTKSARLFIFVVSLPHKLYLEQSVRDKMVLGLKHRGKDKVKVEFVVNVVRATGINEKECAVLIEWRRG